MKFSNITKQHLYILILKLHEFIIHKQIYEYSLRIKSAIHFWILVLDCKYYVDDLKINKDRTIFTLIKNNNIIYIIGTL